MEMTFKVQGIAPICEGSEETDIKTEIITVEARDFGMGGFKAELKFKALGPRHYPTHIKLMEVY